MNIKLFFACFCLSALALTSCGSDSECAAADFIGTWTGTEDCNGISSDATITITAGSSDSQLVIDGESFSAEVVDINDCALSGGQLILGAGNDITGSLSGTTLNLTQTISALIFTETCTYSLTK